MKTTEEMKSIRFAHLGGYGLELDPYSTGRMTADDREIKKFWRVEQVESKTFNPVTPNVKQNLLLLKKLILQVPNIDDGIETWANQTSDEIIKIGEKEQQKKIRLQSKGNDRQHVSKTAIEIFREQPEIKVEVLDDLLRGEDPIAGTILQIDNWRMDRVSSSIFLQYNEIDGEIETPSQRAVELGHEAFELMLFSAHSDFVRSAIADIAIRNYQIVYS